MNRLEGGSEVGNESSSPIRYLMHLKVPGYERNVSSSSIRILMIPHGHCSRKWPGLFLRLPRGGVLCVHDCVYLEWRSAGPTQEILTDELLPKEVTSLAAHGTSKPTWLLIQKHLMGNSRKKKKKKKAVGQNKDMHCAKEKHRG